MDSDRQIAAAAGDYLYDLCLPRAERNTLMPICRSYGLDGCAGEVLDEVARRRGIDVGWEIV